jgi:cysteine desulfurase
MAMRIYLDHNAGAPLRPAAVAAIERATREDAGNPSSVHGAGQRARRMLEQARAQVASLIGAAPREIVFTSGGTESNNLAVAGASRLAAPRRRIVTSSIEHSSILAPIAELESRGFEVVRVAPDSDGRIASAAVVASLDSSTALVTLALANAEVGTIQELAPIAEHAARVGAVLHIDAAQAAGRIPVDVDALGCDLMTLSGHKLGAPAGIGALYVRDAARLAPIILGGPQEGAMRAGTQNLVGAVAFGAAAEAARESLESENERVGALARRLLVSLSAAIPGIRLNGAPDRRLSNTLNFTFPGVLGESLLIALDLEGIEVSMGSACAAGAVEPSHVLTAMGRANDEARSSLRISLGWSTTAEEIEAASEIIPRVWLRVAEREPLESPGAGRAADGLR